MKKRILYSIAAISLLLIPKIIFSQAPNLGSAADFVIFSTNGAILNTGTTHVTGHVGTNNGSSTGFGNVNGMMHDENGTSAQAAVDLLIAYNDLNGAIPDFTPAPLLGNGDILTPGVYSITGATTLNLDLLLDGENDADAVFIFQIAGPLSTNAHSKVKLLNGTQACNVFWKVEGLVDMATGTTMRGTVIVNNAGINMNSGDTLEGRILTTNGAITLDGVSANLPIGCGSPTLLGPSAPLFGEAGCYGVFSSDGPVENLGITTVNGDVGANVGLTSGFDPLLVSGTIHAIPDGSTNQAAIDLLVAYNYINTLSHDIELLYPAQFGANLVLTPHTYVLNAATSLTDTVYLNARGNSNAVFVLKINGALETTSYSKVVLMNGALAENVYWLVNGAVNIQNNSIFNGTIVSQGAITIYSGATVNGNILCGVGAIETNAITAAAEIPSDCGTIVSVTELSSDNESISMYPNPFQHTFTIHVKDVHAMNTAQFTLYNALGSEVVTKTLRNATTMIETGSIPSGIYFYRLISSNQEIHTGRLIAH